MFKYFFKKRTLPKRRGALVPGRLQNPRLPFLFLPFSEAAALRLPNSPGSVSQDRDPLCTALMIVVIQAVQNVAVHLQPGFRRLKQVFEQASAVFLKAAAAGITAFPGIDSLHQDPLFTAALFRVMDAACHGTFQSRHRIYLLFRIQR